MHCSNAGEPVINGWRLSEAFAAQRDHKDNRFFRSHLSAPAHRRRGRYGRRLGKRASKSAFLLTLHRFAEAEKKAEAIRSSIKFGDDVSDRRGHASALSLWIVLYYVMPKMVELYDVTAVRRGRGAAVYYPHHDRRLRLFNELVGHRIDGLAIWV